MSAGFQTNIQLIDLATLVIANEKDILKRNQVVSQFGRSLLKSLLVRVRKNKGQHGLALIGCVLHVNILCIGNITHGIEIGLCDLTHANVALARGW